MSKSETPLTDAMHAKLCDRLSNYPYLQLLDFTRDLERQLSALQRGEFICKRCGIRKDSECDEPDF